jgi:hypothetical protein
MREDGQPTRWLAFQFKKTALNWCPRFQSSQDGLKFSDEGELPCSEDDGVLTDSDDDISSTEDEQERSSTRKQSAWWHVIWRSPDARSRGSALKIVSFQASSSSFYNL